MKIFTTYRSDRTCENKTKGGGAAICIKNGFDTRLMTADQVENCEIVAVIIENINIINIVIYRLPDICCIVHQKCADSAILYVVLDGGCAFFIVHSMNLNFLRQLLQEI